MSRFYRDTTVYFFGSGVGAVLGLIALPIYTRYLEPSDYGIFALFILIASISANLISLVLSQAVYRFYFDFQENSEEFPELLSGVFIFNILCFVVAFSVLFPFAEVIAERIFSEAAHALLFKLALVSGAIDYFIVGLGNLLVAKVKPVLYSAINAFRSVVTLFVSVVLLNIEGADYMDLVFGFVFSQVLVLAWLCTLFRDSFRLSFDVAKVVSAARYSAPLLARFVVSAVHSSTDRVMLSSFIGLQSVGHYSLGAKIGEIFKLTVDALDKRWNAFFLSEAARGNSHSKEEIIKRYTELQLVLVILGFGLITYAEEVVKVLTTEEYYSLMYILPLFVAYHIVNILSMLTVPQLQYAKQTKFLFSASVIGAIVNLVLNFLLIPDFGALGAVTALLVAGVIVNAIFLYYGNRALPIGFNFSRILIVLGLPIFMTPLVYAIMSSDLSVFMKFSLKSAVFLFTCTAAFRISNLTPYGLLRVIVGSDSAISKAT